MNHKAFTLVELAIVMTIIGLLIGGILKGQELLENARVTSTIAQVKSYDAATTAFRDIYGGLPGDLRDAGNRIPGCIATCTPVYESANRYTAGDGYVAGDVLEVLGSGNLALNIPANSIYDEKFLFWIHLLKANLIAGVSDIGLTELTESAWGITNPTAKIGGGFNVGSDIAAASDGFVLPGSSVSPAQSVAGYQGSLQLWVQSRPPTNNGSENLSTTAGSNPLTPSRAEQIDRKMDDGNPGSGSVLAYGVTNSCFMNGSAANTFVYNGSVSSKDCGLMFRLQN